MSNVYNYNYTDLSEIETNPEFLRMREFVGNACNSVRYNEIKAKEMVAKKLLDVFGYPNNIEMYTYQHTSKVEFVNCATNEILACIETTNDDNIFSTEVRYYGDWWK